MLFKNFKKNSVTKTNVILQTEISAAGEVDPTSSSGFSSLLPAGGSSVTLSWVVTAAGFLRRIDPRDESVMLWICGDTNEGAT